ncbi:MAG: hypothetical protein IPG34_18145 [Rhodocyclaceae bacterium]|nr:hypothetical protein [Rhodocyclaceae bacterium]
MTDKVFVDTNILLYARDSAQPDKQPVAQAWMRSLWLKRNGYLSFQVLQEFYVNATQKLKSRACLSSLVASMCAT